MRCTGKICRAKAIAGLVIAGLATTIACLRASPPATKPATDTGFAVVELYTSEGCSSCPPAEEAFSDLIKNSHGKRVYALAFHVDYWDSLGWPDPFASRSFSERQQRYSAAMKSDNVYTPQAIVNGTHEFVGSNRKTLTGSVADALSEQHEGALNATARRIDGAVQLAISSEQLPADTIVNAAIVEDGLIVDVRRGENNGRTLTHNHVVRAFDTKAVDEHGSALITLPLAGNLKSENASIIVFAQRPADLRMVAAAEVIFPR